MGTGPCVPHVGHMPATAPSARPSDPSDGPPPFSSFPPFPPYPASPPTDPPDPFVDPSRGGSKPAGRPGDTAGWRGHRLQYLLLGLGALCLVVAAIAFGAVAWTRMGALAKGAVLAGGTVTAAGLAL